MTSKGKVFLVGAGPGDAGLMTLRGAELLSRADVVIYDALIAGDLLRLAPPGAEFIYAGKRAREHALPQDELSRLLVEKAKTGKCVVRLKGGDPYVFGRGGEEAEELVAAGIPFEVVPGVSSVVAVPNYAGIPITHREHGSSFTVVTGHEDPAKAESDVDWDQVARAPGTKIVLMGVSRIREIASRLVSQGMDETTPVAMVRWGATGRQQSIEGTLKTIAEIVVNTNFKPPAVTVIGSVVTLRKKLNWFESRPLFGRSIVVTRTRDQVGLLSHRLSDLGADILEIPTIRTVPPDNLQDIMDAVLGLNSYDWLVFTSPNGVTSFFDYFFKAFDDMRDLGGPRIAAVGPATAAKLRELHLKVDVMPSEYLASKIASAIAACESVENLRILLLRAQTANPDLPEMLLDMGAIVDDIACYKTVPETEDRNGAAARFLENGADWITFASASTVENFHARFDLKQISSRFPKLKLASIGPETSKAIVSLGLKPDLQAKEHTIEGLVNAIEKSCRKTRAG